MSETIEKTRISDEDILKDLGVTHWMPCDILEALVNTTTA